VSYKWYGAEILQFRIAIVLYRNDAKADGETRYMIARPIAAISVTLTATRIQEHLISCQVRFLSGNVVMQARYHEETCGGVVYDAIKTELAASGKYTTWDLATLKVVHGSKVLNASCQLRRLMDGSGKGNGSTSTSAMGRGKGKVLKKPSKKPSVNKKTARKHH
jgi:hypothetical protein